MIKTLSILLLGCFIITVSAQQKKTIPNLLLNDLHAFDALSKPQRIAYLTLKKAAADEFIKEKYFTCLLKISEAEKIFDKDYELYFWRGLCYTQWGDSEEVIASYQKVLRQYQENITVAMNLFEICYTSKLYEKCLMINNKLRTLYTKEQFPRHHIPLLEFKRLVCLKKMNEIKPDSALDTEIMVLSKLYNSNQDSPFAYYVDALNCYGKKELDRGDSMVGSAEYVFEGQNVILWNKALSDMGYIEEHRFARAFFYRNVDLED